MFFSPLRDVNLAIIIDELSSNTSLDQYTKENINNITTPASISTNKIGESHATSLAGNPVYEIVAKVQINGGSISSAIDVMNIWTVKDGKAYSIGYSGPDNGKKVKAVYSILFFILVQIIQIFLEFILELAIGIIFRHHWH
jgi:hypothetical protein